MPRGKKSPPATEKPAPVSRGRYWLANDAAWGGFINIKIDDEQKSDYHTWCQENPDEGWVILTDIINAGMKVAFAYDDENQCYISTLTGALVSNSNERYCMTSRAGTLGDVIALSSWKHAVLVGGDYGNFRTNGRMSNWG